EVVVDVGGGDARLHRDPGDPDPVDALAGDLADGRGQDPVTPVAPSRHQPPAATPVAGSALARARSARIRSANQATPFSRADSGPHRYPRVCRPCWTLSTRSMSSSSTSVLSRWLAHCTKRVRGPAAAGR